VDEDMFALPGDDDDNDDDIFTRPSGLFTSRGSNLFSDSDQVTCWWCWLLLSLEITRHVQLIHASRY